MAAVRSTDTTPERRLRSALHALGVRYRLGQVIVADGRRVRPDIVFKNAGVAVFVDGCFWHGCELHCRMPSSNKDYWEPKIARNRSRDQRTDEALAAGNWEIIRVWEHDDPEAVAEQVKALIEARRKRGA